MGNKNGSVNQEFQSEKDNLRKQLDEKERLETELNEEIKKLKESKNVLKKRDEDTNRFLKNLLDKDEKKNLNTETLCKKVKAKLDDLVMKIQSDQGVIETQEVGYKKVNNTAIIETMQLLYKNDINTVVSLLKTSTQYKGKSCELKDYLAYLLLESTWKLFMDKLAIISSTKSTLIDILKEITKTAREWLEKQFGIQMEDSGELEGIQSVWETAVHRGISIRIQMCMASSQGHLVWPPKGSTFDRSSHQQDQDDSGENIICWVLFPGYVVGKNNVVYQKAIVHVN